jgi:hypothetical protein
MKFILNSGKPLKSGRLNPDWVAGFNRNTRQVKSGISGRIPPESPSIVQKKRLLIIFLQ